MDKIYDILIDAEEYYTECGSVFYKFGDHEWEERQEKNDTLLKQ